MKKALILFFCVLLFASCGKKVIVDEQRTFAGDKWNRFTPEVFNVDITNTDDYYNIDFSVAIDTAKYNQNILPLTVNIYSPDRERRMFYADIVLKEQGRWKGEQDGKYRVFSQRIRPYFSFNTEGSYRLEVGQATSKYDLSGVHSLLVYIERTKIDYSEL